jgi:hypothetical protein
VTKPTIYEGCYTLPETQMALKEIAGTSISSPYGPRTTTSVTYDSPQLDGTGAWGNSDTYWEKWDMSINTCSWDQSVTFNFPKKYDVTGLRF